MVADALLAFVFTSLVEMVLFIFGFTLDNAGEMRRVLSSFETSKCMWHATCRTFVLSHLGCAFSLYFQQFLLIGNFPAMDVRVHDAQTKTRIAKVVDLGHASWLG